MEISQRKLLKRVLTNWHCLFSEASVFGHSQPGGQTVQVVCVPTAKLPGSQDTALLTVGSGQLEPWGQGVHLCEPAAAYVPEEDCYRKFNFPRR